VRARTVPWGYRSSLAEARGRTRVIGQRVNRGRSTLPGAETAPPGRPIVGRRLEI